jgi:hypothetical protein
VASHLEPVSSHHFLMATTAATIEQVADVASLGRQYRKVHSLHCVKTMLAKFPYRLNLYLSLPI